MEKKKKTLDLTLWCTVRTTKLVNSCKSDKLLEDFIHIAISFFYVAKWYIIFLTSSLLTAPIHARWNFQEVLNYIHNLESHLPSKYGAACSVDFD